MKQVNCSKKWNQFLVNYFGRWFECQKLELPPVVVTPPKVEAPKPVKVDSYESNSFVWKPKGDAHGAGPGKAVVIFPSWVDGDKSNNERCGILTINGSDSDVTGYYAEANGNRPHFRLRKEGCAYGEHIRVMLVRNDGKVFSQVVPNGCERVDKSMKESW